VLVCLLQIVMTATKFTSNIGDAGGGGVQCDGCTLLNATRSSFTSNNASAGGGGGLGWVLRRPVTMLRVHPSNVLSSSAGCGATSSNAGMSYQ
jgi:hypothetical protein